jgi:cysteine desulfurase
MRRIYLDHAATTPVDPRVREAMRPFFDESFGNASSTHWFGQQARAALERSRTLIAGCLGAKPGELTFTSGGTESDNFAIRGVYYAMRKKGRNHIVTTAAEHHAVLDCVRALRHEGAEVSVLPVEKTGRVSFEALEVAVNQRTGLVTVMHANNEVGTITDLASISAIAHRNGALVHTDAVQSFGKIRCDVNDLGVDLASISAHKIYGPKGIGALYVRSGTEIENLLYGGGQERGRRPGTENVALAAGFARAAEIGHEEMDDQALRMRALRDALEERLRAFFPELRLNGDIEHRLPNLANITFDSSESLPEAEMLVMNVDLEGIAVSSGSACTSGSVQPSHVLLAMGVDPPAAKATLRFSFGRMNVQEDVDDAVAGVRRVVERMRKSGQRSAVSGQE